MFCVQWLQQLPVLIPPKYNNIISTTKYTLPVMIIYLVYISTTNDSIFGINMYIKKYRSQSRIELY